LGDGVLGGINGNMGSDIRRWPQSLFDKKMNEQSVSARLNAYYRHCGSTSDQNVQYVRLNDRTVEIYKKLAPAFVLRWKWDTDGRHVQVQLAKPIRRADEMREALIESGYRGIVSDPNIQYPPSDKFDYLLEFAKQNNIDENLLKKVLEPRPGIVRLPVLTPKRDDSERRWNACGIQLADKQFGLPDASGDTIDVLWCAFSGTRRVIDANITVNTPLRVLSRSYRGHETTAKSDAGIISWKSPRMDKSIDDVVHSYATEMAAPQLLHMSEVDDTDIKSDGTKINVFYKGTYQGVIEFGPYVQQGGGAVYTTDFGLKTGFPLTHTDKCTFFLDDSSSVYRGYSNDASAVARLKMADASRESFLAALGALSALETTPTYLVAETSDPVLRMRLAAVLKLASVNDDGPEYARIVSTSDKLSTTPDERHIRIQGKPDVYPLLKNCEDIVNPYFTCSQDFNDSCVDVAFMDAHLDCPTDDDHFELNLRTNGTHLMIPNFIDNLSNTVIFRHKRKRWMNRMKPIHVKIDDYRGIPSDAADKSSILIKTVDGSVGVFDNCRHQDPRLLVLPKIPVYRSTGACQPFMMRPFPSMNDLRSMQQFCSAPQSDLLFRA
jgi:hypothetical protein